MPPQASIPKSGRGITIEILRCANPSARYTEMKGWLQRNKPDASIAEYSIDSEPGKSKWFEANKRFKQTSLPQVVLVYGNTRMHFSDVGELDSFFPKEEVFKKKETCPS